MVAYEKALLLDIDRNNCNLSEYTDTNIMTLNTRIICGFSGQ